MEAINTRDIPGFYLNTTRRPWNSGQVGSDNLFLQYDIYHMQIMEGDLARTLQSHLPRSTTCSWPTTRRQRAGHRRDQLPLPVRTPGSIGYQGWVGCEYKPLTTTEAGLGWLKTHNAIWI
jgi:hydroxypyruvate isomerase